jgi:hypothetical protein
VNSGLIQQGAEHAWKVAKSLQTQVDIAEAALKEIVREESVGYGPYVQALLAQHAKAALHDLEIHRST